MSLLMMSGFAAVLLSYRYFINWTVCDCGDEVYLRRSHVLFEIEFVEDDDKMTL